MNDLQLFLHYYSGPLWRFTRAGCSVYLFLSKKSNWCRSCAYTWWGEICCI